MVVCNQVLYVILAQKKQTLTGEIWHAVFSVGSRVNGNAARVSLLEVKA